MIVTCPECAARYRLADDAIPPEGRAMRCASCKHRWFELPPEDDGVAAAPGVAADDPKAALVIAPRDAALPLRDDAPVAVATSAPSPAQAAWTPADDEPEPTRGSPVVKTLIAVALGLALTAGAAAMWLPDLPAVDTSRVPWLDTLLHPAARPKSPLTLTVAVERQPLGDGRTVFALSGTIRNPTAVAQPVTGVEGRLLGARGEVSYSWPIAAPVTTLAPGAATRFEASAIGQGDERVVVALR